MSDRTPILHLPEVSPGQTQKETTINTAIAILEAAMNDSLALAVAGAVTINDDQYTKYFLLQVSGDGDGRVMSVPTTPRWFAVENTGSTPLTVKTLGAPASAQTFVVPPGKIGLCVSDGLNIRTVVPQDGMGLLQDLSDVTGAPTDKQYLRYDLPSAKWKPSTLDPLPFHGLSDVPSDYFGQGGKLVAVKNDGSGLEFIVSAAGINDFLDLADTPKSYSGDAGLTVKVNSAANGLVFARPALTDSSDFPAYSAGAAGNSCASIPPTTG